MRRTLGVVTSAVLAIGILLVGDRLLQPVPIPAGTTTFGGLVPFWLGCRKTTVAIGAVGGTIVGVAIHAIVHATGRSTLPPEGVPVHVFADGARGLGVAVVGILVVMVIQSLVERMIDSMGDANERP